MIKKFLMILLSITILLSSATPILAAENENIQPNEYTGLLKQINVFDDEDNLETLVTRAEFAGYIARILDVDEYTRKEERYFTDVPATYWKSNSINGLAALGIISGGGDSEFRPDDNITYSEAATILIKAMGYDTYAKLYGGYPDGYIKEAAELKITNGVRIESKGLTKASAARLLYNALDTVVLKESGSNANGIQYDKTDGYTFLYKCKSIRKETGIVTGIYGISLDRTDYPYENQVRIADTLYEAEDDYVKPFLGKKVNYYYIDDEDAGTQTVVYMYDRGSSQVIEIDFEDFEAFDANKNTLRYYDGSRSRNVKIAAGAEFIMNGSKSTESVSDFFDSMNLGKVTVYDMDNNGTFETVICENYEIGVVRSNDADNNRIYVKYLDGGMINQDDYGVVKVYLNSGEKAEFSDIREDDVISVIRSNDYLEIYISRETVTGKIENITEDSVKINGTEYSVNKYIKEKHNLSFYIGTETTFKLNHTGYIVDTKSENSDDMEYAYLRRTYRDEREDFYLRLFTFDRSFKDFAVADRVKVDGKTYKSNKLEEAIYKNKDEKPMLIRYNVNENGEINQIDTPSTLEDREPYESEHSLTITLESSLVNYHWVGRMGKKNIITDSTKILIVPSDDEAKNADISHFSIGSREELLISGTEYLAECYSVDTDKNYEDIVVIKEDNRTYSIDRNYPKMVAEVLYTINDDDEPILSLSCYDGTTNVKYTVKQENFPDITFEKGDLIYVRADSNNEIKACEMLYKYKNGTPVEQWGEATLDNGSIVTSGWVVNMKNDIIKYGYYDCTTVNEAYNLNSGSFANVTYFDGKNAWVAPSSEIITGEMNPYSPDRIITGGENPYMHRLYVYRTAG